MNNDVGVKDAVVDDCRIDHQENPESRRTRRLARVVVGSFLRRGGVPSHEKSLHFLVLFVILVFPSEEEFGENGRFLFYDAQDVIEFLVGFNANDDVESEG